MEVRPGSPGIQLRSPQTPQESDPAKSLSIEDAISIAEDGASAVGGLLGFIMGLVHRFGHVNHPLLPDKIADALNHVRNAQSSLSEASAAVKTAPVTPTAADTP